MSTLEENRYAEIAVKEGIATSDQIFAAQNAIDEAAMKGQRTTLLDVLVSRGTINAEQKQKILSTAEAQGPIRLGDFEVVNLLGQGGMGSVYKAREVSLDRLVALKLLPSHMAKEPSIVARFRREAQASAKLDHPNIIRGYRVGDVDGQHYFAMELVEGTSVQKIIEQSGPMALDRVLRIAREIAGVLSYAHKNGMIHRDIKPDNIMITKEGVAKLADLGLVKATDEESTRITVSGTGMGTPAYMPPEQARGAKHVDARSDLYSFGATLYHMVTGRMPYEGNSAYEVIQMHEKGIMKSPKSLRNEIPEWLDLSICKLMQRKPENRFQTAEEFLQVVERNSFAIPAAPGAPVGAVHAAPAETAARPSSRIWHLRIKQKDGSVKKAKTESKVLRALIKEGKIPLTTQARMGETGEYRPLSEFRDLVESAKTAVPHSAKDHKGTLKSFYHDVEVATRRRKQMRLIKRIALRVLGMIIVIILIVLAISNRQEIIEWVKGLFGG